MEQNRKAFLDVIAHSEFGVAMLAQSDDGYNVITGSRQGKMILFSDYSKHPRKAIWFPKLRNPKTGTLGLWSTAAGRYQFTWPTWNELAQANGLSGFSPVIQDIGGILKIRQRGALDAVDAGRFDEAVFKCRKEWASLPGANYGQHENSLASLQEVFVDAGGVLGG